jgi:type 1 fimbriae regulatory protein FimB
MPRKEAGISMERRRYLTEPEIKKLLEGAKKGRHGVRDHLVVLLAYRHGLRASELVDLRLSDLDLETGRIFVRRVKGSVSASHPLPGDELRAIRSWLRKRGEGKAPFLFLGERGPLTRWVVTYIVEKAGERAGLEIGVHPHMLRHSCGYYLANKGHDTRLIQDYLGHKNITHTVRYTKTAAARFEGLWR